MGKSFFKSERNHAKKRANVTVLGQAFYNAFIFARIELLMRFFPMSSPSFVRIASLRPDFIHLLVYDPPTPLVLYV
jgi:hypothetical protein